MLEHLSSLRRKSSEKAPSTNNTTTANHENLTENKNESCCSTKEVNDVYKVSGKSKNNIFKSLISDNGATNIFSNLLKCPDMHSTCTTTTTLIHAGTSSNSNGNAKQNNGNGNTTLTIVEQQQPAYDSDNSNNRKSDHLDVQPCVNENHQNIQIMKKRNSVVKSNGEFISSRELSPIPSRVHRKSCHDIRLMRNNQLVGENGDEVGKLAVVKPLKTRNIVTKNETFDMLYPNSINVSTSKFFKKYFSLFFEIKESFYLLTIHLHN